jgi:ribosome-associated protein
MAHWEEYEQEGRGRSAAKRAATAIEDLAKILVDLSEAEYGRLPLEGDLRRELGVARSTGGHSSRKRQIKHFAALLRRDEETCAVLRAFVDGSQESHQQQTEAFHQLEQLRDRLCDPQQCAAALGEVRAAFPLIDAEKLAGLARSVHAGGDKKAYREIFRRLRGAAES